MNFTKRALYSKILVFLFYSSENGDEDSCLIMTSLRINDLNTFIAHLLNPEENSQYLSLNLFERSALVNVLQNFGIFDHNIFSNYTENSFFVDVGNDILFEENCSTVELKDEHISSNPTQVNVMQLSDKTINYHFSNQDGQLVCLVCYKIFVSNSDLTNFRKHLSEHPFPVRKWGHLLGDPDGPSTSAQARHQHFKHS